MANQAANNALMAISANLHPGNWDKCEEADENLRSFNQWFDKYLRWTNVCLRGVEMDDSMKWDMLVAAAGNDLAYFGLLNCYFFIAYLGLRDHERDFESNLFFPSQKWSGTLCSYIYQYGKANL